jgi:DNA-directed RNA polymerase specialized sigma24 family protein
VTADQLLAERETHLKMMARALSKRLNRPDLKADLQQWARIGLWQHVGQAPEDPEHRARWCSGVIRTSMVDGLRSEFGRRGSARDRAQFDSELPELPAPCTAIGLVAVREVIDRLADLPPRQYALAVGLADGQRQGDIEAVLGVSNFTSCKDRRALRAWVARMLEA